jgi:hypothetical protein
MMDQNMEQQNGLVQQVEGQAEAQADASGKVDVEAIIREIQVPPELKDIFDKAILSGERIMFDKQSHALMLDELDKPGPIVERLANGMISLVYMLWQQSNMKLPPQLLIPVTVVLTLRAFEFLQDSGEAEATPLVLGDAMDAAIEGVAQRAGVEGGMEGMAQHGGQQPSPQEQAQQPAGPTGLIGAM